MTVTDFSHSLARLLQEQESGAFRCFSSFLAELGRICGAEQAGLLALEDRTFRVIQNVELTVKTLAQLQRVLPSLANYVVERKKSRFAGDGTFCFELKTKSKYLVLRQLWLFDSTAKGGRESVFLFLLNPQLVVGPGGLDHNLMGNGLAQAASAFARWKNEIIARHDELLSPPLANPDRALLSLEGLVIRPVQPAHFREMLSRLTPSNPEPLQWAERVNKLFNICKRPKCCKCLVEPANAIVKTFSCPQTDALDNHLGILAQLELWQTGFWKMVANKRVNRDWASLLSSALEGLDKAADALHWQDVKRTQPIDFSRGAVGLAGERALLRHFCAHAIRQALDLNRKQWSKVQVHCSELEFPSKLASLASTLLGDGKWTPEAIENLLQVVALYGHNVLGIPGRIDLVRHLRQTLRGETALHTLKSRYRDHFFHTLEVCFLGFALLTSRPNRSNKQTMAGKILAQCKKFRIGKSLETLPSLAASEQELLAQWWVAALVHDTAYGIDIYEGTLKLLDFFTNRKDVKAFLGKSRDTVGELGKSLCELTSELKTDASLKKGDHGVIAAASLAEVLDKIGGKTARCFLPSVRAIAFHNTRHPKVNAGADPVAALLILCDTVQEWGRSSLGFDRSPSVLLSRMMEASLTPAEEQFGPVKRYGLSLTPAVGARDGIFRWEKPNALNITLDYGKEVLRECKGVFVWADTTYNLQRVNFEPWGISLSVHVSMPKPDKDCKSQFCYLGDFIREQEVRFVQPWFQVAYQGDTNRAVAFSESIPPAGTAACDSSNGREIIAFNLTELGKAFLAENPLMGGSIGDFASAMMKWSVFAREQSESPPAHGAPI